jgi:hypothetical protein
MNKLSSYLLLAAGLTGLATPALADTVSLSGNIDGSEPTFDQPLSASATLTGYDTYDISVTADGVYSFLSFYAGDTSADANMDGVLLLYQVFDPLSPGGFLASDDDYTAGDVAALGAYDAACIGSNCSGFDVALTAGVTYVVVQTTFTDVPNSFGQPTGSYDMTITGPGTINAVPVPGAVWLMLSALAGFGALRRRHA